ncbi:MAG: hypothetical protein K2M68_08885 [Muribaculaceae bacterium]|nr:hypothetical protein [Muribaculaceae bacterium]
MKKSSEIRHRRLYAFYNSRVLNALMIVVVDALLLMACYNTMLLPVVCSSVALLLFIGYALWLWIAKPRVEVINRRLSDMSGYLMLYFLIMSVVRPESEWWYIIPLVASIAAMFVTLTRSNDEAFEI